MKNKVYAVKNGRKTGLFYSWPECQEQIKGFKGALFKGFPSEEAAQEYLNADSENEDHKHGKSVEEELALTDKYSSDPSFIVVYTDGSNTTIEGKLRYSYGLVVVENNKIIHEDCAAGENEEATKLRNVAGELSGVMKALLYAKNNKPNRTLVVFHDYEGVSSWAKGDWKAHNPLVKKYIEFVKKFDNIVPIQFVKVAGHQGNPFNERADYLARRALGLEE